MRTVVVGLMCCCLLLNSNMAFCTPRNYSCDLYEEEAWMNLNVSEKDRSKIDEIILKHDDEMKAFMDDGEHLQRPRKISDELRGELQEVSVIKLLDTMQKIDSIRKNIHWEMISYLSPGQQETLDSLLDRREARVTSISMAMMAALALDDSQMEPIISQMLLCQKQIWSIVSDTKLSWEQRKEKMQKIRTLQLVSNHFTKQQQAVFDAYLQM